MSKSLARVKRALADAGIASDVLEMGAETRTAAQAAEAAGCDIDQIAKSIIFKGLESGEAVLFLTAGGNRVDDAKAAAAAGEPLGKADAALVRAQTGFAIGGVAPLGHTSPMRAFCDLRLTEFARIWAAGGTPRHIFPLTPHQLLRVTNAQVIDFTG
ncbi:YbaK/EbsC family protein [Tranquillimonas alkanivorans]|uniref:Cys-tRNA(Pro) deacylase, prolyl-tRNA editing enzyme YbaK/EbsC n=1 Tax=Tranquillimonas alkanivorans TaxID=441119 RepID=A0A1I5MJY9_9RHOB|nr:YbaK/EbsC family protein [Tranquillimonas alkanivorans]SFP09915.1 Cys-tRNA(Pro) deacylase, prolyl-tRNA editing enzyme YbaK/EbsC [Tranquillimonas alkanivorans]